MAINNGIAQVPTAKRFADALASMRLSKDDRDMLICHYNAPGHKLTSRAMSARE